MLARHERDGLVCGIARDFLEVGAVVVAVWQADLVSEAAAVAVVETASI